MKELLNKALPKIPDDITSKLNAPHITLTPITEMDEILRSPSLQEEIGFKQFPDGSWLVSMNCPMPGITADMISWWFWWHCQDDLRYQVWFPGDHISISYKNTDRPYFDRPTAPAFRPNSQRPVEKIGGTRLPLQIDFVTPEDFGFSLRAMEENGVPIIVCGHVGVLGGIIKHTEMAHVYRQTNDGLFMTSRFWLGANVRNPILRKLIFTEKMARGMAEHCCIEYRNLVEILPGLYAKYGATK